MKVQKGLAPILIILLIAAATFGYLIYSRKINLNQTTTQVAQPSPATDDSPAQNGTGETANWKTFESKYFGISYKYPADWENDNFCQQCPAQPVIETSDERYLHPKQVKYQEGITYIIDDKKYSISVDDYKKLEQNDGGNQNISEISVDGYKGIRVSASRTDGENVDYAIFENKDYIFQISSHKGYSDILDKILSTIKFQ